MHVPHDEMVIASLIIELTFFQIDPDANVSSRWKKKDNEFDDQSRRYYYNKNQNIHAAGDTGAYIKKSPKNMIGLEILDHGKK